MNVSQTTTGGDDPSASTQTATAEEHLVLRLRPIDEGPRVTFTPDTVDNEHAGRLKSNCCCIYVKPRQWDDPSTWEQVSESSCFGGHDLQDEGETEHCRGHTLPDPEPKDEKPAVDS